jgi:hypothetical protein
MWMTAESERPVSAILERREHLRHPIQEAPNFLRGSQLRVGSLLDRGSTLRPMVHELKAP